MSTRLNAHEPVFRCKESASCILTVKLCYSLNLFATLHKFGIKGMAWHGMAWHGMAWTFIFCTAANYALQKHRDQSKDRKR